MSETGSPSSDVESAAHSVEPIDEDVSLSSISDDYKAGVPDDLRESYSCQWYLNQVVSHPKIARSAHQRLADMFDYYGREEPETEGEVRYTLASEDPLHDGENVFFGENVHGSIHRYVNKVKSGARGLGPERRIKLLLGPVGSGKSHFDQLVRRYFEDYTRRDAGRMYTFRWVDLCDVIDDQDPSDDTVRSPMNQDPLVLLPRDSRERVLGKANENLGTNYTLRNDQALDPESAFYLEKLLDHYDDDFETVLSNHVEIVRLVADENRRECIETFEPKDKKNQDETELTGDINYSKLAIYGESDPRAFDYSGALCNANRGIFSGEELLKLQREFLYDFLHATQEGTIKPRNNPRIDIDQVIVGRSNMPEYRDKRDDEKMEAFNDRTKRIDYPYVLEYEAEADIYERLLENADIDDITVEPHTLEMAALFAVLTRIQEPTEHDINRMQKAKVYNGEAAAADDFDPEKLRDEGDQRAQESEGMDGVSPRFLADEIAEAITDAVPREQEYISPLTVLSYIEENLEHHGSVDTDRLGDYGAFIGEVRDEYEDRAIEDVRHALAYDLDEIREQGEKYMDHVMAYINDETVEDDVAGEEKAPDETFMRAVEEQLDIPDERKDDFRQEVSNWVGRRARQKESFSPKDNERLRRALERKLWEDKKHNINYSALVNTGEIDDEDRSEWVAALEDRGYSEGGAMEVLEFAGAKVAKDEMQDDE